MKKGINSESEMVKAYWGFHIPAFSVIHNESEMVKDVQELESGINTESVARYHGISRRSFPDLG